MENLEKLLNDFEASKEYASYRRELHTYKEEHTNKVKQWFNAHRLDYTIIDNEEARAIMISKRYKFIDWLITNWKIDNIKLLDLCGKDDCVVPMHFEDDKQKIKALILILSISDDPINDLISVLKEWADK